MIAKTLINHTANYLMLYINDAASDKQLMMGCIKDLEDESNKAYKRLCNMEIQDFKINKFGITIWV